MQSDRSYRKANIPENAQRVFEGKIFDVYQWEQELYDGSKATYEKLSRPDTAVIYPILEDGRILLINDSQPQRPTVLSAPSGRLEEGEKPEEAIRRELLEETGYEPTEVIPFYTHEPYEKIDWVVHVFIGRACKKVAEQKTDPGEKIQPHPVSFEELIALTVEGKLRQEGFSTFVMQGLTDPAKMAELKKKFFG